MCFAYPLLLKNTLLLEFKNYSRSAYSVKTWYNYYITEKRIARI